MKKLSICLVMVLFVLCGAMTSWGSTATTLPLVVVDGGDPENTIGFEIVEFTASYEVGQIINDTFYAFADDDDLLSNGIQVFLTPEDIIDFAISDDDGDTYLSLGKGDGIVTFSGNTYPLGDPPTTLNTPIWVTEWYSVAILNFGIVGLDGIKIISAVEDDNGLAPVPIPATALLFCSSILGIVGIRRKMAK